MDINTRRGVDEQTLLRHLLRVLADSHDHLTSIQQILDAAQSVTGARGGMILLFNLPQVFTFGTGANWQATASQTAQGLALMEPGLCVNPPQVAHLIVNDSVLVAAPLVGAGEIVGGLLLQFDAEQANIEQQETILFSLVDAASVVASRYGREEAFARGFKQALLALNTIADPLLVLDGDKRVVLLNPAAEEIFGVSGAQVTGLSYRDVVQAADLIALIEENRSLAEWSPEESAKVYAPRMEVAQDADGQVEGYVLALHDITRYKKLNLNQAQFLRIVSHDLRSPLTSMQGFASMLELSLVGEMNDKQRQFVQKILSGIGQITALVDNIQDAGRFDPETGFYDMSRSHCDLSEIVHRIVKSHLVPAEKNLAVTVRVENDVPIINADANMLERAITNLFDNAVKYTPDGGAVDVRAYVQNGSVILSVRDTGLGISLEHQKLLFQRHVRIARHEHKKIKGTGLGLFIVRSVAQRHGGDAWVESVEGQGSTFYFSIPLSGQNTVVSS